MVRFRFDLSGCILSYKISISFHYIGWNYATEDVAFKDEHLLNELLKCLSENVDVALLSIAILSASSSPSFSSSFEASYNL